MEKKFQLLEQDRKEAARREEVHNTIHREQSRSIEDLQRKVVELETRLINLMQGYAQTVETTTSQVGIIWQHITAPYLRNAQLDSPTADFQPQLSQTLGSPTASLDGRPGSSST